MDSDEQICQACKCYRNAVLQFCKRYTSIQNKAAALPKDIEFILHHTSHVIRQLTQKRRSLQAGLEHLQTKLWSQILTNFFGTTSTASASIDTLFTEQQAALLQHFLAQILRLHDGIFLLVSGECRHPGDKRHSKNKKTKYPSQLAQQRHRNDGYTKLYNAPGGYSGFGWDEFFDEQVGLQRRLLQLLQKYSQRGRKQKSVAQIQDYLNEHGAQMLESLFDHHESEMNSVKEGFRKLQDRVVRDIRQKLAAMSAKSVPVVLSLHDKMEHLQVGSIKVDRRGDTFQVMDPQGVLPTGYTGKEWSKVMQIPISLTSSEKYATKSKEISVKSKTVQKSDPAAAETTKAGKKRRRAIIEDSDDDHDDDDHDRTVPPAKNKEEQAQKADNNNASQDTRSPETSVAKILSASTGLQVKVQTKTKSPQLLAEGRTSLSLASIKTQMGANIHALEASREELEKEEAGAVKAARLEEEQATATSIAEGEATIRRQRRVLARVLSRSSDHRDSTEIWAARELLREQLMTVGNQILWEPFERGDGEEGDMFSNSDETRKRYLLVALKYFEEAKDLVKEQEVFRRQLYQMGEYTKDESLFVCRNLLLMGGRAHVNMGITYMELAMQTKNKFILANREWKQFISQAIVELTEAKRYAESLRNKTECDRRRGSNAVETWIDDLQADQLESLALRWWGCALWRQGLRKDAMALFEAGASFFVNTLIRASAEHVIDDNERIIDAFRQLGADCFSSCILLVDLAWAYIDDLIPTEALKDGNDVFELVKGILLGMAMKVSVAVVDFLEAHPSDEMTTNEFMEENHILSLKAIGELLAEIEQHLVQKKTVTTKPIRAGPLLFRQKQLSHRRSEVELLGFDGLPTRFLTLGTGGTARHKRKPKGPNPAYHNHSGERLSGLPRPKESSSGDTDGLEQQPRKYRPWGDELLPQVVDKVTGKSVPKIEYPSVAPIMPPEIRALLEAP